jgi:hypothetical protein
MYVSLQFATLCSVIIISCVLAGRRISAEDHIKSLRMSWIGAMMCWLLKKQLDMDVRPVMVLNCEVLNKVQGV